MYGLCTLQLNYIVFNVEFYIFPSVTFPQLLEDKISSIHLPVFRRDVETFKCSVVSHVNVYCWFEFSLFPK